MLEKIKMEDRHIFWPQRVRIACEAKTEASMGGNTTRHISFFPTAEFLCTAMLWLLSALVLFILVQIFLLIHCDQQVVSLWWTMPATKSSTHKRFVMQKSTAIEKQLLRRSVKLKERA